jgi:hypothetical protein
LASFHVVEVRTAGKRATKRRTRGAVLRGARHRARPAGAGVAAQVLEGDVRRHAGGGDGREPLVDERGLRGRGVPRDDQPRVAQAQRAHARV